MTATDSNPTLRDEEALRWCWLEDESDACIVVSDRMEFVYINAAARALVPEAWFGKRCFEVLPVVDETCALHCPKIRDANESTTVVYCEEMVKPQGDELTFGVGLIPLGKHADERARAVLFMRDKQAVEDQRAFQIDLLRDAERVRRRIDAQLSDATT